MPEAEPVMMATSSTGSVWPDARRLWLLLSAPSAMLHCRCPDSAWGAPFKVTASRLSPSLSLSSISLLATRLAAEVPKVVLMEQERWRTARQGLFLDEESRGQTTNSTAGGLGSGAEVKSCQSNGRRQHFESFPGC